MAYSQFSLGSVKTEFQLAIDETQDLFGQVAPRSPSELLRATLQEQLPLATAISTEKARSELILMPVLVEVRRQLQGKISIFSGKEFTIDRSRGLEGFCDYLLTASPEQYYISCPVVAIVEAKNENIVNGLGQCLATMVAAQLFNQQANSPDLPVASSPPEAIYGVVTTGTDWKFLRLLGRQAAIDRSDYYIKELDKLLGIFYQMFSPYFAN